MGGLAHYLEEEGLATTQISLIREHTEAIKPPRALWVPFELGRPIGVPDEPAFQIRILTSALELLNATDGPVLKVFSEEAPATATQTGPLACPVNFEQQDTKIGAADHLVAVFKQEVAQMHNWYDRAAVSRGRTTADTTGLAPEKVAQFLADFVQGDRETNPVANVPLAVALRMAAEDLKAYYLEAVTAQPGQPTASTTLANWFWSQTAAARVINSIRLICLESSNTEFQLLGKLLLVPRTQLHNFEQ